MTNFKQGLYQQPFYKLAVAAGMQEDYPGLALDVDGPDAGCAIGSQYSDSIPSLIPVVHPSLLSPVWKDVRPQLGRGVVGTRPEWSQRWEMAKRSSNDGGYNSQNSSETQNVSKYTKQWGQYDRMSASPNYAVSSQFDSLGEEKKQRVSVLTFSVQMKNGEQLSFNVYSESESGKMNERTIQDINVEPNQFEKIELLPTVHRNDVNPKNFLHGIPSKATEELQVVRLVSKRTGRVRYEGLELVMYFGLTNPGGKGVKLRVKALEVKGVNPENNVSWDAYFNAAIPMIESRSDVADAWSLHVDGKKIEINLDLNRDDTLFIAKSDFSDVSIQGSPLGNINIESGVLRVGTDLYRLDYNDGHPQVSERLSMFDLPEVSLVSNDEDGVVVKDGSVHLPDIEATLISTDAGVVLRLRDGSILTEHDKDQFRRLNTDVFAFNPDPNIRFPEKYVAVVRNNANQSYLYPVTSGEFYEIPVKETSRVRSKKVDPKASDKDSSGTPDSVTVAKKSKTKVKKTVEPQLQANAVSDSNLLANELDSAKITPAPSIQFEPSVEHKVEVVVPNDLDVSVSTTLAETQPTKVPESMDLVVETTQRTEDLSPIPFQRGQIYTSTEASSIAAFMSINASAEYPLTIDVAGTKLNINIKHEYIKHSGFLFLNGSSIKIGHYETTDGKQQFTVSRIANPEFQLYRFKDSANGKKYYAILGLRGIYIIGDAIIEKKITKDQLQQWTAETYRRIQSIEKYRFDEWSKIFRTNGQVVIEDRRVVVSCRDTQFEIVYDEALERKYFAGKSLHSYCVVDRNLSSARMFSMASKYYYSDGRTVENVRSPWGFAIFISNSLQAEIHHLDKVENDINSTKNKLTVIETCSPLNVTAVLDSPINHDAEVSRSVSQSYKLEPGKIYDSSESSSLPAFLAMSPNLDHKVNINLGFDELELAISYKFNQPDSARYPLFSLETGNIISKNALSEFVLKHRSDVGVDLYQLTDIKSGSNYFLLLGMRGVYIVGDEISAANLDNEHYISEWLKSGREKIRPIENKRFNEFAEFVVKNGSVSKFRFDDDNKIRVSIDIAGERLKLKALSSIGVGDISAMVSSFTNFVSRLPSSSMFQARKSYLTKDGVNRDDAMGFVVVFRKGEVKRKIMLSSEYFKLYHENRLSEIQFDGETSHNGDAGLEIHAETQSAEIIEAEIIPFPKTHSQTERALNRSSNALNTVLDALGVNPMAFKGMMELFSLGITDSASLRVLNDVFGISLDATGAAIASAREYVQVNPNVSWASFSTEHLNDAVSGQVQPSQLEEYLRYRRVGLSHADALHSQRDMYVTIIRASESAKNPELYSDLKTLLSHNEVVFLNFMNVLIKRMTKLKSEGTQDVSTDGFLQLINKLVHRYLEFSKDGQERLCYVLQKYDSNEFDEVRVLRFLQRIVT